MHLYSALLCIAVHPKRFTIMWWGGGSLLNHHQCADGCHRTTAPVRSPHTSYRWRGERVIEPIKWMGIIGRPVVGIWLGHQGYTSTLYKKCHRIFNDHRESGPRFNISSERRMPDEVREHLTKDKRPFLHPESQDPLDSQLHVGTSLQFIQNLKFIHKNNLHTNLNYVNSWNSNSL